jgi:HAD superfamily hydrolase (TIGR01509 family)
MAAGTALAGRYGARREVAHSPLKAASMAPLKAVIFDLDGTLVDSNDLHIEAWREAFGHYGISVTYDDVHAHIGKGGDQLIPVFCSQEQVEQFGRELERLRVEIFARDYLPQARPYPKVRKLFEGLKDDGLQIALATSSRETELATHLENLGIEGLYDVATSADDAEHSKPAPDIFETALARLEEVDAAEAIVIGDTPYDAMAAGRAGIRTIAVLTGGFSEETLREAGAIAVYADIEELLERYDEWAVSTEEVTVSA